MKYLNLLTAIVVFAFYSPLSYSQNEAFSKEVFKFNAKEYYKISKEQSQRSPEASFEVNLPIEENCLKEFYATPSNIMSNEYRKLYPEIQTYVIRQKDDPSVVGRMMISSLGISYFMRTEDKGDVSFAPVNWSDPTVYMIERGLDPTSMNGHSCQSDMKSFIDPAEHIKTPTEQNGDVKRILRLAITTTGFYYQAQGNNPTSVNNSIMTTINAVEFIYSTDLNVGFTVLTPHLNADPNTDGFSPAGSRTDMAAERITELFGADNFDVGQVLHSGENGYAGGGVAYLGAVCRNAPIGNGGVIKAGGWSGWSPANGNAFVFVVAHELGHMFNGPHTWNALGGSCQPGGISPTGAYEIGSGTSVMSYFGLCGPEQNIGTNYPSTVNFHANTIQRMHDYLKFTPECENLPIEDKGNNPPISDANPCGAIYNMPKGVPFFLTGKGSDPDSEDQLTYQWEPYNEDGSGSPTQGYIGATAANSPRAPIFRSYPPNSSQTRYFPRYNDWVEGVDYRFENIPQVARTLHFRYVVRDNNVEKGAGIAWDEISINVRQSGPLIVEYPAGGETFSAGDQVTFQWNPNGNDDVCDKADLLLSLDGGYSFPIVIADDVDYAAGSHTLSLPQGLPKSDNARLMVRCDDFSCFKFFNMSEAPFSIESSCFASANGICNDGEETYNTQDPGLNMFLGGAVGSKITNLTRQISNGSPNMFMAATSSNGNGCAGVKNTEYEFVEISCTKGGGYTFNLDVENQGGKGFATIYEKDGFDPQSPCSSFIKSSARATGQGTVLSYNDSFTANLVSCRQYILALYNDGDYPVETIITNIDGPGDLLASSGDDSQNFNYTYIAVDQFTGLIDMVSDNANFINLLPGDYQIYGAYYKNSGPEPPNNIDPQTWLGKKPEEIYLEGQCGVFSSNFKPITILSTCSIDPNVTISSQSACDPNTNLYTQTLVVNYAMNPTVGQFVVNGQEFDITGSPQTIVLTGLLSDSEEVDLELLFSEDPQCYQFISDAFSAADNCCPFEIALEEVYSACEGETITLNTEVTGADHIWFKNGAEIDGETGESIIVQSNGAYTVEVRNSTGCLRIATTEVSFSPLPEIDLGEPREVCGAGTNRVNASTDASTIEWFVNDIFQPDDTEFYIPIVEEGEYKAIVTNSFGCSSEDSVELTVLPTPVIDFPGSTFLCDGETGFLDAGEGETYKWTFKGDTLDHAEQIIDFFNEGGIYTVTVTNEFECSNTGQTVVVYNDNPEVNLSPNNPSICENGGFVELQADVSGASNLQWYFEGEEIPNANDFALLAPQSGTYQFTATSNLDCSTTDSIIVGNIPAPTVDLPMEQFICGTSIELSVEDMPGETYTWSIGPNELQSGPSSNYIATTEGVYTLVVTSSGGCSESDNTTVSFGELVELELGPDIVNCDESFNLFNVSNTFNVQWFLNGEPDPNGSGGNYFGTETGLVLAIAENTDGCTARDSMYFTNYREPEYDYPEELTLCNGTDFSFELSNPDNYDLRWLRDGIEVAFNENPYAISESGLYRIEYISGAGCDYNYETQVNFVDGPDLTVNENLFEGCDGEEFTIIASTSGSISEWQYEGVPIPGESGNTLDVMESGTYTVVAGGIGGDCEIERNIEVIIGETPMFNLGNDISSCGDTTITLEAPVGNYSYQWFLDNVAISGEINSSYTTDQEGIYSVEVIAGGNCIGSDEILIEIGAPPIVEISGNLGICGGQSTTLMAQSIASQFQWFFNGTEIPNAIGQELIVEEAGEYSVITNPGTSCSSEAVVNVVEGMGANISIGDDIIACEGTQVMIEADTDQGTFEWFLNGQIFPGDENSITTDEEGIYQLNVTDNEGCVSTATAELSFTNQSEVEISDNYSFCSGGSVILEANTMDQPIVWYFEGNEIVGENSLSIEVMEAGTYTIEVGAGDCSAEATTEVTESTNLSVDLGPDESICLNDGFTLDAGPGGTSYIWSLNNNQLPFTEQSITPTVTGSYVVEVIINMDCTATDEIFIEVGDAPSVQILETEVSICIGENYIIEAITDGLNFQWLMDGIEIPGETFSTIEVSEAGIYTIQAWNDNQDCISSEMVELLTQDEPDVDLGQDIEACEGTPIILSAGNTGTDYTWFRNGIPIEQGVNEIEITESGTYSVEVSSGPNCVGGDEIEIQLISVPDIQIPTSASFCTGDMILLEANGFALSYQWSVDGNEINGANDDQIIIDESGLYTLEAYNDPACPIIFEIEVIETDSPQIDLGMDTAFCTGESIILDAGNIGQDYVWFLDGNPIGENESTLEVSEAGIYSVNVSAGQDCEGEDEIEISIAEIPIIESIDNQSICDGQSIIVEATVNGGSTYNWYLDGDLIDDQNSISIEITEAGEYTFEAYDNPDCGETTTFTLETLSAPSVDLGDDIFTCQGMEISLDAGNQGTSYQWFLDGEEISGENMQTIEIEESGIYSVIVFAGQDCDGEDSIIVDFSGSPLLMVEEEAEFCTGSSVIIEADSDANFYQWYLNGNEISGATESTLEVSEEGVYTVEAFNNEDCPSDASIEVFETEIPQVDLGDDQNLCLGETFVLSTDIQGENYEWLLDGTPFDDDVDEITVNQSGTYTLIITITEDCVTMDQINIDISDAPNLELPTDQSICDGQSITITADSDATNFQWYLDGQVINGENENSIDIDTPGEYSVEVFNNPACTSTESITVGEGQTPDLDIGPDLALCPNESILLDAGSFDLYEWSDGTTQESLFIVSDGPSTEFSEQYSVTVTNSDNCTAVDEVSITFTEVVTADIDADNTNLCTGETALLTASGGDSYSWNNPNNSLDSSEGQIVIADPQSNTTYVVTVTDDDCEDNVGTASITINVASANIVAIQDTCIFNGQDITLTISGGNSYQWDDDPSIESSTNGANITVSPSETTTYRVLITDEIGCEYERYIEVCVNPSPAESIKFVTVITPNGDGENDVLEFEGLEDFPLNKIQIFNRWGVRIYEQLNYQNDDIRFAGTRDGVELPPGIYYYILEFEGFEIKKSLTIIRE